MADILSPLDSFSKVSVNLPLTQSQAGYVSALSESDSGSITGSKLLYPPEVSNDYRFRVGMDSLLFCETFPGAAINTTIWNQVVSTMTITQANGFANLNPGLSTASGAVARLQTYQHFPIFGTAPHYWECLAQFTQTPQTNNVCEWGIGLATGTTAPTDGAFFRLTSAGNFIAVVNFNGTEVTSSNLNFSTLVSTNTIKHFAIEVDLLLARFWINDVLVATINVATAGAINTASYKLPTLFRNYNSGVTGAAQVLKVSSNVVSIGDAQSGRSYPTMLAAWGGHGSQGQTGGTIGTTAQWANTTTPSAATGTNTTAALGTGLGGLFQLNAAATSTTDVVIASFQNPAGTAALPGRNLLVYGCWMDVFNNVVAVATTATIHCYAIAYGHTNVSLATTEAAGAKAPRRQPLGSASWLLAAAVGAPSANGPISRTFTTPLVVYPGEFIAVVCKIVLGTATATEVFTHNIGFDAAWE